METTGERHRRRHRRHRANLQRRCRLSAPAADPWSRAASGHCDHRSHRQRSGVSQGPGVCRLARTGAAPTLNRRKDPPAGHQQTRQPLLATHVHPRGASGGVSRQLRHRRASGNGCSDCEAASGSATRLSLRWPTSWLESPGRYYPTAKLTGTRPSHADTAVENTQAWKALPRFPVFHRRYDGYESPTESAKERIRTNEQSKRRAGEPASKNGSSVTERFIRTGTRGSSLWPGD